MKHVWTQTDPIHAAIERHRTAFNTFQIAPEGIETTEANDEYDAATNALISTACTTRFGAAALLGHLHWWIAEEEEFSAGHQPAYGLAEVRAADLALFLGEAPPSTVIPTGLPSGHLPPPRRVLNLRRASRKLVLGGEILGALAIVSGGMVLTGLATMI